MEPMISVLVPVYEVETYLPRCIQSILGQSYSRLEVILVDDGSRDTCGQICEEFAGRDPRVRVIHKENGGVASARNAALASCTGEYILFVDGDDTLAPEAVERLYKRLLRDGSDMAVGKHGDLYPDGSTDTSFCDWMRDEVISGQALLEYLGTAHYISVVVWGKLYRRAVWEDLMFPPLTCGEDTWVFPLLAERCRQISIVDSTVYFYRQRQESIMHQRKQTHIQDDIRAVAHLVSCLQEKNYLAGARRWFSVAVDKGMHLKDRRIARRLLAGVSHVGDLLKGTGLKNRVKYISLYLPFLYDAVQLVKQTRKRG